MISFKEYLAEFRKNQWSHLLTTDKTEYHQDLIDIVDSAYKHTTLGSFVKTMNDVKNSEWLALDYDNQPDIDIAIFFRKSRSDESWLGQKIQGIGHDGEKESKIKLMQKVTALLTVNGWWIEASHDMANSLKKRNVEILKDPEKLKKIFPSISKIHNDGSYDRKAGNETITEYIFGKPKLK